MVVNHCFTLMEYSSLSFLFALLGNKEANLVLGLYDIVVQLNKDNLIFCTLVVFL